MSVYKWLQRISFCLFEETNSHGRRFLRRRLIDGLKRGLVDLFYARDLDSLISVPSPVIVATGTGQVGEGLQNTWGLEEDDDEGEEMADVTEREQKKGTVTNKQISKVTGDPFEHQY